MEIKLQFIDQQTYKTEQKTYRVPFATAATLLDLWQFEENGRDLSKLSKSDVQELAKIISRAYKNQFSPEEFIEGTPSFLLMTKLADFLRDVNTNPYPETESDKGKQQTTAK